MQIDAKTAIEMKSSLKTETDRLIKEGIDLKGKKAYSFLYYEFMVDRGAEVENASGFFEKRKRQHVLDQEVSNFISSVAEIENVKKINSAPPLLLFSPPPLLPFSPPPLLPSSPRGGRGRERGSGSGRVGWWEGGRGGGGG